jgi:hypothetical protein
VFVGYLLVAALARVLPLDFGTNPGFYYWTRFRGRAAYPVPFDELLGIWGAAVRDPAAKVRSWAALVGLFAPAGLLAAHLPARTRGLLRRPLLTVAAVALAVEAVRILVMSIVPSATNVVLSVIAAAAGWFAGRAARNGVGRRNLLPLAAGCVLAPLTAALFPFDFRGGGYGNVGDWTPFADLHRMNPAFALEAAIHRAALYLPLGALVAAVGPPWVGWRRPAAAGFVGAAVAASLEAGKGFLPGREPSITTVLLAAAGAVVAAVIAGKIRLSRLFVARVVP